jgi:hypothetical protein
MIEIEKKAIFTKRIFTRSSPAQKLQTTNLMSSSNSNAFAKSFGGFNYPRYLTEVEVKDGLEAGSLIKVI